MLTMPRILFLVQEEFKFGGEGQRKGRRVSLEEVMPRRSQTFFFFNKINLQLGKQLPGTLVSMCKGEKLPEADQKWLRWG